MAFWARSALKLLPWFLQCRPAGFWDTRERMGGRGDRVHYNSGGYRKLASVLFADLMQ